MQEAPTSMLLPCTGMQQVHRLALSAMSCNAHAERLPPNVHQDCEASVHLVLHFSKPSMHPSQPRPSSTAASPLLHLRAHCRPHALQTTLTIPGLWAGSLPTPRPSHASQIPGPCAGSLPAAPSGQREAAAASAQVPARCRALMQALEALSQLGRLGSSQRLVACCLPHVQPLLQHQVVRLLAP